MKTNLLKYRQVNVDKVIIQLLLCLFFLFNNNAAISTENTHKHIFWKVKSQDATIFLLGSIHLAQKDIYPLDSIIENSFHESENLVVELDVNKIDQKKVLEIAVYSDKHTLADSLSPKTYQMLKELFKKHSIPSFVYNKFKPWFAALTLYSIELKSKGFESENGIDIHFLNKAQGKNILELESFEEQIKLFTSIDNPDKVVDFTLEDMDSSINQVDSLFNFWKVGDVENLTKITLNSLQTPGMKDIKEIIYDKRNRNMTGKIEEYLNSKGIYFVIVGAGHLVGDNGIIEILKKSKKYLIEQL